MSDIREYESIRVATDVHKLRHSHHHKLIQSGPGQTIMLRDDKGYIHFAIVESGLEIPASNVASAIPKSSTLASKMQKTTGSRLTPKLPSKKVRDDDGED